MHGSKGAAWPDGRLEGAQASAAQSGGKAESAMGQTGAFCPMSGSFAMSVSLRLKACDIFRDWLPDR